MRALSRWMFPWLFVVGCDRSAPDAPRDAATDVAKDVAPDAAPDAADVPDAPDVVEPTIPLPAVDGVAPARDENPDPHVVEVTLRAAPATAEWLPGMTTSVLAYNGTVPGPLIQARVGDTVRIHVHNDLDEGTTVHWHGLRITDIADGSPLIQPPIPPGGEHLYEFVVRDAGTFWYHSHVSTAEQIERGLYGALVVHEAAPPPVDRERLIVLDDVKLSSDGQIAPALNLGPDVGRGRLGNVLLVNGRRTPLAVTSPRNAVERWRLVNAADARSLTLRLEGATWRVVGTDGGLLAAPYGADTLVIAPGQRYDLEVRMDASDATSARLVAAIATAVDGGVQNRDFDFVTVSFEGEVDPRGPWQAPETVLPEVEPPVPALRTWNLSGHAIDGGVEFTINGMAGHGHGGVDDAGVLHTEPFDRFMQGEPVRITLRSDVSPEHPFHLHGQFFQIVAPSSRARAEPGLKDTVLVRGIEPVTILTWFENPGRWMFHCHIAEHAERGMMGEFVVLPTGP